MFAVTLQHRNNMMINVSNGGGEGGEDDEADVKVHVDDNSSSGRTNVWDEEW